MSFTQSQLVDCLQKVYDRIGGPWALAPGDVKDWTDTLAKRIRVACRHTMQAEAKGSAGWL